MNDSNLEIITVPLDSIQVVGRFGSPLFGLSAVQRAVREL